MLEETDLLRKTPREPSSWGLRLWRATLRQEVPDGRVLRHNLSVDVPNKHAEMLPEKAEKMLNYDAGRRAERSTLCIFAYIERRMDHEVNKRIDTDGHRYM